MYFKIHRYLLFVALSISQKMFKKPKTTTRDGEIFNETSITYFKLHYL